MIAAAGALWLLVLAGLGYLQLGDVVPTPDLAGVPAPTALLIGGVVAGLLLSLVSRLINRFGARRRARRARRAMHERIVTVADELVIAPLEAELSKAVNQLGVGPQGLGGDSTSFAVHVETAATHITMNPVAVNMQCHSARRARATFTPAGIEYGF